MTQMDQHEANPRVIAALGDPAPSVRLNAALAAGSTPTPEYIVPLIDRCALEPDFFVRDMLTWALIQHDHGRVIEHLLAELSASVPQARAQALHTLSKIGDGRVWPAITVEHLTDPDDDVARAAWRTAAAVVPAGSERSLADTLATQWGRGDHEVRLSLSRAFAVLGEPAGAVVDQAIGADHERIRRHALDTRQLIDHPDRGVESAVEHAKRIRALSGAPAGDG